MDFIRVRGARTHNLRSLDLDLPRNRLTVVTGPSGSGKSSLAFDTLYAEGQRRYVESLSAYARQFLERMQRPEVDLIEGLSPAIAIGQRAGGSHPRSTVGTVTEVDDHLRLLYARTGAVLCPRHPGEPLLAWSVDQMVDQALSLPEGAPIALLAPVAGGLDAAGLQATVGRLRSQGFVRFRLDGAPWEPEAAAPPAGAGSHALEVVVDRLRVRPQVRARLAESFETALRLADGRVVLLDTDRGGASRLSSRRLCPHGDYEAPELEPGLFSFNNPAGACPACHGLGRLGANDPSAPGGPCPECGGSRLRQAARFVVVGDGGERLSLPQVQQLPLAQALDWCGRLRPAGPRQEVGRRLAAEIAARLRFLVQVGLGYLSLARGADSLSGGEAQRIRLASQIGSGLTGVLYVLDEPSIGLHPRDNRRLIETLLHLRDLGNTVLVVEHDEETIRAADHVVDLGPGAGMLGGRLVAQGTPAAIAADPGSPTGAYLSGRRRIPLPARRRAPGDAWLRLRGARGNNLRDVDLDLPLGLLVAVTGVSGSGKSTLVGDTLVPALARRLHGATAPAGPHQALEGVEGLEQVLSVDQAPIGRTPRSNPATYAGLFGPIRELFAGTAAARERGYGPARFSFNVAGGRCEHCEGAGVIRVEMHFLPDVYVPCETCRGRRYNRETLEIHYRGRDIAEVLGLTVGQARDEFDAVPALARRLAVLAEVGLDYLTLGQSATTLSGGEAQRLRLAPELARRGAGRSLYVLDEPTTGLHFGDIAMLLQVLLRLRDAGNTVLVVEHNLEVVKTADWVVDLGPEGGAGGGQIVAAGPPEAIAAAAGSHTGAHLRALLAAGVATGIAATPT